MDLISRHLKEEYKRKLLSYCTDFCSIIPQMSVFPMSVCHFSLPAIPLYCYCCYGSSCFIQLLCLLCIDLHKQLKNKIGFFNKTPNFSRCNFSSILKSSYLCKPLEYFYCFTDCGECYSQTTNTSRTEDLCVFPKTAAWIVALIDGVEQEKN